MKKTFIVFFSFFSMLSPGFSQSTNVNCATAFEIENPIGYCSGNSTFDNTNASGSEIEAAGCFVGVENDVWFKFTAVAQAVNIVVNADNGGTLSNPRVIFYEGSCADTPLDVADCISKDSGADIINLFQSGLVVGESYLIRVGGAGGNQGSFQLCLNNYNPPIEPGQDASSSAVLCDKSGFVIQTLSGGGSDADEAAGTCLDVGFGNSENQSSWTSWVAENDGTLIFTITPINTTDDIDFVLYELPNGINDFSGRIVVRCMASGCPAGGPTGLNTTSNDTEEPPGCPNGNDNFLAALNMEAGKAYALLINNFTETGIGIALEFGGTGEFQGPDPEFAIIVDEVVNPTTGLICDKQFEVVDESSGGLGTIVNYEWNFGQDAIPQTASGPGPFNVEYETTGNKYVVLTVSSDLGCNITEVRELEVEACCSDPEALAIEILSITNIGCEENEKGSFTIGGIGGFPEYSYRFMGGEFTKAGNFSDLEIGDYEVGIIDRKGCESTQTISIIEANPIEVNAGPDASIEFLGDSISLEGTYNSGNEVNVYWSPDETIKCADGTSNCLNPIATPLGTTTYTLTIVDSEGCTVSDDVTIEVEKIRPLYAPNIFSPNEDGFNDIFSLSGNEFAVSSILELNIYDRWGNLVYTGRNLSPNDETEGWDGKINGRVLDAGVYIWFARLEFLDPQADNEVITGDITLIR